MSEDEALAAALAASMTADTSSAAQSSAVGSSSAEEEDRMLALALQESERLAAGRRGQTAGGEEGDKSCSLQ